MAFLVRTKKELTSWMVVQNHVILFSFESFQLLMGLLMCWCQEALVIFLPFKFIFIFILWSLMYTSSLTMQEYLKVQLYNQLSTFRHMRNTIRKLFSTSQCLPPFSFLRLSIQLEFMFLLLSVRFFMLAFYKLECCGVVLFIRLFWI